MREIKTGLAIRALLGAVLGMLISAVIMAFSGSLAELSDRPWFFLFQIVGSGLNGAICFGSTVVYSVERWGLLKPTVIHCLITFTSLLTANFLLGWFPGKALLIALPAFVGAYAVIWIIEFLLWKRELKKMNAGLDRLHLEEEKEVRS